MNLPSTVPTTALAWSRPLISVLVFLNLACAAGVALMLLMSLVPGTILWRALQVLPFPVGHEAGIILGLRTNVWAAIFGVILGLVIFFVQKRRHPGLEPSPYVSGREWNAGQAVQSQDTDDFVDVSEPPTSESVEGTATSTPATK